MKKLKVLFVLRPHANPRAYESIVAALQKHGHEVILPGKGGKFRLKLRRDIWRHPLLASRQLLSYRSYFFMKQSSYFRDRWVIFFPEGLRKLVAIPGANFLIKIRLGGGLLSAVERIAPPHKGALSQLREIEPDIIISAVANMRYKSSETDYIKAAKVLGIPTAYAVLSWDNLTIKGKMHILPDVLLAWNSIQINEAWEHHGMTKDKIKLVGATVFDHWFKVRPEKSSREEFCRKHGMDPGKPIFTYLGSSANIAKDETAVVLNLKKSLEGSPDKKARSAQMIFRPHQANMAVYENFPEENGIFHFPKGRIKDPVETERLYYETLIHSDFLLGINTSAMLEAIILDRPVVSYLTDEFKTTQSDAQHFQELVAENTMEIAESPQEFAKIAATLFAGEDKMREQRKRFIKKFIRPNGRDMSAGEYEGYEIEKLAVTHLQS